MFENRRWLVIPVEEIPNINFDQVLQSSIETLKYSIDKTETFVKYDITEYLEDVVVVITNPETLKEQQIIINAGIYGRPSVWKPEYKEYKHDEILELLSTKEWSTPQDI